MYDYFYESEFEDKMFEFFQNKYALRDDILQEYLFARYLILNKIQKTHEIECESFSLFLAQEMGIKASQVFTYKDSKFYINSVFDQSISNIVSNQNCWRSFIEKKNLSSPRIVLVMETIKTAILTARSKPKAYKDYVYLSEALKKLNAIYNVSPVYCKMENTSPLDESIRTLEERIDVMLADMSFSTQNHKVVKEKNIEEFIFKNLYVLLNILPVKRQYVIEKDCIADIYGYKDNTPVIIELKNGKDDRLMWQINKYKKHVPQGRIIVMTTEIESDMVEELKKLSSVEVYRISPTINSGKVTNVTLNLL